MSGPIKKASMLRCEGMKVVNEEGEQVVMRGACLGAYLLQENFTNGYPGHEKAYREAMLKVLGQEKYDFFWNKFYEYFFSEKDAEWFASLGLNMMRLAINYRHLEDDMNPRVIKKEGFKWIDRVIEINAKYGILTILDLHAAPGGQNFDWHSDNNLPDALLWEFKDFQDRTVVIWEAIAERYRGNKWVAGYNLLNEPTDKDPECARLLGFYKRLADAVRAKDPEHILCFDGNIFGADFSAFERNGFVYPNSIFSCHDYSLFGFPIGRNYTGSEEDKAKVLKQYNRKVEFSRLRNSPIWNGEFGPVWATEVAEGANWEEINRSRVAAISEQLRVYGQEGIAWTIWLYKDTGVQGMIHASENSKWWKVFGEKMTRKRKLGLEFWGTDDSETTKHFQPALDFLEREIPEACHQFPKTWKLKQHFYRRTLYSWIADALNDDFVAPMKDMSFEELDELAASYKFENCDKRDYMVDMLSKGALL